MRAEIESRIVLVLMKAQRPLAVTEIEKRLAMLPLEYRIIFKDFSTLSKGLKSMYLRGLLRLENPKTIGSYPGRPTFYTPTPEGSQLATIAAMNQNQPTTTTTTDIEEKVCVV